MDRVDAHSSFYLEEGFLRTLHRCLPGRLAYVFALQDDRPVSVELILFRDGTSYAYLGGTRTEIGRASCRERVGMENLASALESHSDPWTRAALRACRHRPSARPRQIGAL